MEQYLELCERVIIDGVRKPNRTGIDTIGIQGHMMKFDLADGFPAITTKKLYWRLAFIEMLGFLRAYDSAAQFRLDGCKVWDANANDNTQWLTNPYRQGTDHLGRIYGVQARKWIAPILDRAGKPDGHRRVDQLSRVVSDLAQGIDNRREIVTHWNPGETDYMALPPCHLLYQFGIEDGRLNMCMYQRSCDIPLGVPFNIAGYAWLLSVIAKITRLEPGVFTHFLWDAHIYVNQIDGIMEQLQREPHPLPTLWINDEVDSLSYLERYATKNDFELRDYVHHEPIKFPFAV